MSEEILFEQQENIGFITINKPKANQLSHGVFEGFRKILDQAGMDAGIRVLVVRGSGDRIFCAGADLTSGFGDFGPVDFLKRGQDVWNKIEAFPKPVIAAINGHAYGGGCELAMACHFRFMKADAKIGLTEINLGIMPGYGGTLRLPRLIGRGKALECMLLGKRIEAAEALELGLVNRVCAPEQLFEEVTAFAKQLAAQAPLSMRAILKIMTLGPDLSSDLHLKMEREALAELFKTKDMMEGMTAFMQKRTPVFKGE